MRDISFIRLEPTLAEAKETNPTAYTSIAYLDQVQLSTTGKYTQITNTKNGIAFDGNFQVFVCDCEGEELLDITPNTQITEFTDNKGRQQIAWTVDEIGTDFYKRPVLLKFKHTVSDSVWYSNIITITDFYLWRTTRFDYRDYSEFHGVAYNRANVYQSIRLNCLFIGNDSEPKSVSYTSVEGLLRTSRLMETEFEKYHFDAIDNFTYIRLNKLLSHPIIYVDDKRVTNKQTLPSKEFTQGTNIMPIEFKVAMDYNENLIDILNPKDFLNIDWNNSDFLTN